jgi:hypothetical protein
MELSISFIWALPTMSCATFSSGKYPDVILQMFVLRRTDLGSGLTLKTADY